MHQNSLLPKISIGIQALILPVGRYYQNLCIFLFKVNLSDNIFAFDPLSEVTTQ